MPSPVGLRAGAMSGGLPLMIEGSGAAAQGGPLVLVRGAVVGQGRAQQPVTGADLRLLRSSAGFRQRLISRGLNSVVAGLGGTGFAVFERAGGGAKSTPPHAGTFRTFPGVQSRSRCCSARNFSGIVGHIHRITVARNPSDRYSPFEATVADASTHRRSRTRSGGPATYADRAAVRYIRSNSNWSAPTQARNFRSMLSSVCAPTTISASSKL